MKKLYQVGKEVDFMPNILPVSDLRNYNEVLKNCQVGEPVFWPKMVNIALLLLISMAYVGGLLFREQRRGFYAWYDT